MEKTKKMMMNEMEILSNLLKKTINNQIAPLKEELTHMQCYEIAHQSLVKCLAGISYFSNISPESVCKETESLIKQYYKLTDQRNKPK